MNSTAKITLAAFQFAPRPDEVDHNLKLVRAALEQARDLGVSFVGLPEMWPTSFVDVGVRGAELVEKTERALSVIEGWTRELELVVCGTGFAESGVDGKLFNRLHVIDRGKRLASYDKVHLFSPTAEPMHFVAGRRAPEVCETSAGRMAGATCYDLRFPELFRPAFRSGVQIFCVPAQWPDARATHWRALSIARAIENQCFVVAVNRTGQVSIGRRGKVLVFPGNSLIVSPEGQVVAEGAGESGLVVGSVDLADARHMRVRVPVEKDERRELHCDWVEPPSLK